jgi:8-oxo-dGTP diphosphatase
MIQVVCGILIWNDNVLIGKRKLDNKYHPGKWEFPGGKVEVGESHWDGIRREFKEELDIEVLPFHQLRPVSNDSIELTPFTLKLVSGKAKMIEHDELKFVDKAEFFKMELTDLSKEVGRILFDSYSIFLKKEK